MIFGRWLRNRSRGLEYSYKVTHSLFQWFDPIFSRLGYDRIDRWIRPFEEFTKKIMFDCRMCGQCILHSTGMTCPMTCPKNLRNGPCGGVRSNGHCEVIPEMRCIWVEAFERSNRMSIYGDQMLHIQAPANHQLSGSSAWVNILRDERLQPPAGWVSMSQISISKE